MTNTRLMIASALVLALLSTVTFAESSSKLEEFEEEAKKSDKNTSSDRNSTPQVSRDYSYTSSFESEDDDGSFGFFDIFGEIIGSAIYYGGARSFERSTPDPESITGDLVPRQYGDISLPLFRLDGYYGNEESDLSSENYRAEIGYGPFAYFYRNIDLKEDKPSTSLELSQSFFSYRTTISNELYFNINFGTQYLKGSSSTNSGAFGLSAQYHSSQGYGFEYSWSQSTGGELDISDHEFAATYSFQYYSARIGIRSLNAGSESIHGAFAGIALHF